MNIVTIIFLIIIIAICFIFFIRSKVTAFISSTLKIGFFTCLLIALSALFIPQIYNTVADFGLRQVGTYDRIVGLDNAIPIKDIQDAPGNIIDKLGNLFGNKPEPEENQDNESGYFEDNLYSSFVNILGGVFRIFSLLVSVIGLIVVVYLSYISTSITDLEALKRKYNVLESRLQILENKQNGEVILAEQSA